MTDFVQAARLDILESVRARWYLLYSLVFGGLVATLFAYGLADSRVLGFTGLSRFLVTYIQISMAIMPVFVLITTVRSLAGDREAGVLEYMLALPIGLGSWYWGRFVGRFVSVFVPVLVAMLVATAWGAARGAEVPWYHLGFYTALLLSLTVCFLGIGFLISSLASTLEVAQSSAFVTWLVLLLFLDLILLGVIIRGQAPIGVVVAIALVNPLQVFRVAAMMLFDQELVMLGPSSFVILDAFGRAGYIAWALLYPLVLGLAASGAGFLVFRNRDLI
jgi:ABC-2 type transport system permease protein